MAANHSLYDATLPPLPEYTLYKRPDLVSWFPDNLGPVLAPVIVYWATSMIFHFFDVYDLFPQYRLHTPEEISSRNHVTRWECLRDVIIQQIVQTITGYLITLTEAAELVGREDYDVAVWARRLRIAQRFLPTALAFVGLNAADLSKSMSASHPLLAGALAGGHYPSLGADTNTPTFASWEIAVAKVIYHALIPGLQFFIATCALDSWQYALHRAMHMNKFLYSMFSTLHPWSAVSEANFRSPHSLPPSPPICSICLRRTLQPPPRGLPPRYTGRRSLLQAYGHDYPPGHMLLHVLLHEDC